MKRALTLLVLPLLLVVSGCSLLGSGDWEEVRVNVQSTGDKPSFSAVVTPTKATFTVDGKQTSQDLPTGTWQIITAGLSSLGDRKAEKCPDGEVVKVEARAEGAVKFSFGASSCDAEDALSRVRPLIDQLVALLR